MHKEFSSILKALLIVNAGVNAAVTMHFLAKQYEEFFSRPAVVFALLICLKTRIVFYHDIESTP